MNAEYMVVSSSNPRYPEGLINIPGDTQLYVLGNMGLLGRPAVGICGSREASPEALDYATKFGREATKQGFVVVSGYARGVDRQAHKGAMEAGGATIAVLAEGINYFRLVSELKPLVDLGRNFLAVSMFDPNAVWKSWQAMERNKLIVALSTALFVVEARAKSGTINAAMECVRQKKSLWAIAYSREIAGREGNKKLLQALAIPLKYQGDLRKALEESMSKPAEEVRQLVLNLL